MMFLTLYIIGFSFLGFQSYEPYPWPVDSVQRLSIESFKIAQFEAASDLLHVGDRVVISDRKTHRLYLYTVEGELIRQIGGRGHGPQSFSSPTVIATINGLKIYVSDSGNQRVQILDRELNYLSQLSPNQAIHTKVSESMERTYWQPSALLITPNGECMVWDAAKQTVYRFNPRGELLGTSQSPSNIETLSWMHFDGTLVQLYDASTQLLHRMSPNGMWMDSYSIEWSPLVASGLEQVIEATELSTVWNDLIHEYGAWVKTVIDDRVLWMLFEGALFRIPLGE